MVRVVGMLHDMEATCEPLGELLDAAPATKLALPSIPTKCWIGPLSVSKSDAPMQPAPTLMKEVEGVEDARSEVA